MSCLGNIIWFLFAGLWQWLGWTLAGLLWTITIVGIPIGRQCFKFARLCFSPFGKDVVYGGGLKQDNAAMLASIEEIDGGLIALTRFQGEIGFYPDEYIEIIRTYLGK